jgi:mannan polymerase II complex ANP1 subunit
MQYSVIGLPHYTIWHLYEPSADDLRHMAEMDKEKKKLEEEADATKSRDESLNSQFDVAAGKSQWEKDKESLRQNALAREDAKAEKSPPKPDVKPDQAAEKPEVGPNEDPGGKPVENSSGGDDGKSEAAKKVAPAAFVAANAPLGNLVAKTQEKLQHRQQQQRQQRQGGSVNPSDQNQAAPELPPDHAAAVAAANMARQESGGQEDAKGL